MIRLTAILLACVTALAQNANYPIVVTSTAQLATLNPTGLRAAVVALTDGNIEFAYSANAVDATNSSTTSPIIKPNSYGGRWFGKKVGAGSGTGDLLAANNLSDVANTNSARVNLGAAAQSDLTTVSNSVVVNTANIAANTASLATKLAAASNLSDVANAATARSNIGALGAANIDDTAYNAGTWDSVAANAPSKNAVRDQIETVLASITAAVSDIAYNAGTWDSVTTVAPSKNAVRDQMELKANLASPTFTGTPAAPTPSAADNTTKIATTAYVQTELGSYAPKASPAFTGTASGVNLSMSGSIVQTIDAIAALAIDWSTGNTFSKTIGSNSTFTFSGATAGQWITVKITASGSFTATWPTVTWQGGSTPTQTASKTDFYTFFYDGTTYFGSASQNF